jgi:enoyl-CoA hydratase/carnithine racemase
MPSTPSPNAARSCWPLGGARSASAPAAVQSTRASLRLGLAEAVQAAHAREHEMQARKFAMNDFREGVQAAAERRLQRFTGT